MTITFLRFKIAPIRFINQLGQVTSNASPYVAAVTAVLKEFETKAVDIKGDKVGTTSEWNRISFYQELAAPWVARMLHQSFASFSTRLDDVLVATTTQEISLKRLQRRRVLDVHDGMSDAEKIGRQLLLVSCDSNI